ncbi:DsrE family protein [Sphingomonas canadensis]|uniref:DsrE family protein n=1 Tax=Sphingomonas canadensis TaxID=1219257 RepID=A0ABW3H488_9SPHN|nr:DsrE family protein [Sphingomonas canadensis]MCW3835416.1 DsrE family protein [Sphingomonas canadensis]
MRGLTILVAGADAGRLRSALTLACAHAALGGRTRLFVHEAAVPLLAPGADPDAALLAAHGLPDRAGLIATAAEAGVALIACQTGLALAGLAERDLPPGFETGGLMGLLATLDDDRLDSV